MVQLNGLAMAMAITVVSADLTRTSNQNEARDPK
jgi:hypothetical protein